jgi:hypothetical protein
MKANGEKNCNVNAHDYNDGKKSLTLLELMLFLWVDSASNVMADMKPHLCNFRPK